MLPCYNTPMKRNKSLFKNVPRPLLALGIASLLLNAIFIGIIIVGNVLESSGELDYARVYDGIERMCSDEFRQTVIERSKERGYSENDSGMQLALVDFPCSNNGAKEYYEKGLKDYALSLGLKP